MFFDIYDVLFRCALLYVEFFYAYFCLSKLLMNFVVLYTSKKMKYSYIGL